MRRFAGYLAVTALFLAAPPLYAQDGTADPDLEALIPDAAVTDPEAWAKVEALPAQPMPEIDPASPLAEIPGFTLPWPDETIELAQIAPLAPDPDVALALQQTDQPAALLQPGGRAQHVG